MGCITMTKTTDKKQSMTDVCINKLSQLPLVQTKHLTQLFGFNDGGKYLRRHLRKHFTQLHEYSDPWVWRPNDKQLVQIIEYFVDNVGVFNDIKRLTTDSLTKNHDVNNIIIK